VSCSPANQPSFLCWSLSFYPQPYSNYKRRSTQGLAIDFSGLNLLGFTSYTISTAAFLWSPTIRDQYAKRHPVSPEPTVRLNDFAFAAHAFVLCLVTYSQFFPSIWGFDVSWRQRPSRVVLGIISGCIVGALFVVALVVSNRSEDGTPPRWEWIDVVSNHGRHSMVGH
jgi:cystinosin